MTGYTHNSKTLWRVWDPEFQKMEALSDVIFDKERNAHMSCLHGSNETNTDMFGLPGDGEYIEVMDTGDQPLWREDSQPTQLNPRSTSHMHEDPDEEAENAHSRRLCREDQTAQCSAADAESIAHSRRLHRKDQTARRSDAMKNSSQVLLAAPAPDPPIGSCATRSQAKSSAEAFTASAADPFTYTEAMEMVQRDHWKRALEE